MKWLRHHWIQYRSLSSIPHHPPKGSNSEFHKWTCLWPKCHTVLDLCLNMLHLLFLLCPGYTERGYYIKAYIKLIVAQEIKTLEIIV